MLRVENVEADLKNREIAMLRGELDRVKDENDMLRQRIAEFFGLDTPWPKDVLGFRLTPIEEKFLRVLAKRDFGSKEMLYSAIYDDRVFDEDLPDPKIIDVKICHLRKKLPSDAIETIWGRGYRLTDAGKAWLKAKLEGANVQAA